MSEGALLEVQLCPGWGLEHPVGIVHGLSDSSPSDLGCGAAANPAKLMSEGSALIPSTRDCGVDATAVSSCFIMKSLRHLIKFLVGSTHGFTLSAFVRSGKRSLPTCFAFVGSHSAAGEAPQTHRFRMPHVYVKPQDI